MLSLRSHEMLAGMLGLLLTHCGAPSSAGHESGEPAPAPSSRSATPAPNLSGRLTDAAAAPLEDSPVLACMTTTCLVGRTQAGGEFQFNCGTPAQLALKTPEDLNQRPRRAALLAPIRVEGAPVDVGALRVPTLPDGVQLSVEPGIRTYDAGDGLRLWLSAADLVPQLGDTLVDVAARNVPLTDVGALARIIDEELVAVYALHPFAAQSSSPIGVEAPAVLPDGTRVNFRSISEIDGHLSDPVPGSAFAGVVKTDPDAGVQKLTWLVVSRAGSP